MTKSNKLVIVVVSLSVIALILAGVFMFLWGKSSAENKTLKAEKKEYLNEKKFQDSIINASAKRIELLTYSIDSLVSSAQTQNDGTVVIIKDIEKDKQKMHEDINHVNTLTEDAQLKLFSKQADQYRPR